MRQKKKELEQDIWLQRQLEAIRHIKPVSTPDVTDAVMQHIGTMPSLLSLTRQRRRRNITVASGIAAACFAGLVLLVSSLSHNELQAATQSQQDLDNHFFDVYDYCHHYAEMEPVESPAYLDNPVSDFINLNIEP